MPKTLDRKGVLNLQGRVKELQVELEQAKDDCIEATVRYEQDQEAMRDDVLRAKAAADRMLLALHECLGHDGASAGCREEFCRDYGWGF